MDWPYDDKAQIQDLDNSTDDVTLIPVLDFNSTTKPSLSSEYGLIVADGDTASDPYRVLAPLSPVGKWGATDAFKVRIALTSAESASRHPVDGCAPGMACAGEKGYAEVKLPNHVHRWFFPFPIWSCTTSIETTEEVAVSYYESSFRMAGLSVTESEGVEVALLGAPNAPETSSDSTYDEGREIFNLATNFASRFLYNTSPDLKTVTDDFKDTNNTIYTDWHIDSTLATSYNTFTHRDIALATTTITNTKAFLDANYSRLGQATAGAGISGNLRQYGS